MNGFYLDERENGLYAFVLPNGAVVALICLPTDGREDMNFDALFIISRMLGLRWGMIDGDVKEFKGYRQPNNIKVVSYNGLYHLYMNGSLLVASVNIPKGVISAKVIAGISIILEKRWSGFIRKNTMSSNINNYIMQNKASRRK